MNRFFKFALMLSCFIFLLTACMANDSSKSGTNDIPEIPQKLQLNEDDIPILKVYDTNSKQTKEMDIETYLMGVVAGEMKNSWPSEALKAQAILARTFTMKFVSSKTSSYDNADISTDVQEAQAYNPEAINDRIREAVNQTRGMVMVADGEFPHAWFHAHAGGITELPSKALEYGEDPAYLSVVESRESDQAPDEVKYWTAVFTLDQVRKACKDAGVETGPITKFEVGERGESGRAVTFLVNGEEVSAPSFRLQIGASELKSTLIDSVKISGNEITFEGRGFGHGVGMSQWGAHQMANEGLSAEEIIKHYYTGIELAELW